MPPTAPPRSARCTPPPTFRPCPPPELEPSHCRIARRLLLSLLATATCSALAATATLDLSGDWRLRLDPEDAGLKAGWPAAPLDTPGRIALPNTTDRAGFGFALDPATMRHAAPFPPTTRFPGVAEPERADEHGYLVRRHLFVGPAWYERDIDIPPAWESRPVIFRIERALWRTDAFVDGRPAGSCDSLAAPHRHDLGPLAPGRHRLTVRVDNRLIHNLSTVTHAYGPETQSRWNGLVGALTLEAAAPVDIRALDAHPAPDRRSVRAVLRLDNTLSATAVARVELEVQTAPGGVSLARVATELSCLPGGSAHEVTLTLPAPAEAWDEFHPIRHRLVARVRAPDGATDEMTVLFGFRHVQQAGRQIRLNGRTLFLRGTLDCAVYPLTGHPPMDVEAWERVLGVIKAHGFNHVRYHTWCPPGAAFEAADRLGLYLQPEAAAWVDDWGRETVTKPAAIGRDPAVTEFLRAELRRMSEAYGNHPSFLLCAIGNEFGMQGTDWERVNVLVDEIRTLDPRRLYAGCGARRHLPADEFWFTHHTGAGTRGVGPAHTDWDFSAALEASPVPLIAHETGQRPVFPDYPALLPKFTGPLLPLNLERHRRGLESHGLADRLPEFVRASARFQFVQYKAEHEAMLRTRGYAGYQLLMLNDFTGQSEALVGLLDPFWDSKGVVGTDEVRSWNAPTTVVARFAKYTWTAGETFRARIEIAHFGPDDLPAGAGGWTLLARDGRRVAEGRFDAPAVPTGGLSAAATVEALLDPALPPLALTLVAHAAGFTNRWNLWVYPAGTPEPEPPGVRVTTTLDAADLDALESGARVVLLAHGWAGPRAARTGFESVYWSAGWWGNRFSSLGITCDPGHPALRGFPNDGHSDWQWRDLCAGAATFDLTEAPAGLRPIVQPVPDFHFNTPLGQVFEARVGRGSLLVCGYDLKTDLDRRPAVRQFRSSLFRYAAGGEFRPEIEVSRAWIESLRPAPAPAR